MFQVWFCDRFIPSNSFVHKYPRILHWMTVSVGDKFIKDAMETGLMVDEYGATRKEMGESFVKASLHQSGQDTKRGVRLNKMEKDKVLADLDQVLEEQDGVIKQLEEELYALKADLVEDNKKDESGYVTPTKENDFNNDFPCEGGIYSHASVSQGGQRRKRYKSKACRTPYTGYSPNFGDI